MDSKKMDRRWLTPMVGGALAVLAASCVRPVELGDVLGDAGDSGTPERDAGPDVEVLTAACPPDVPEAGASCSISTLRCEYGTSAVPECNTIAYCELEPLRFTLTSPAAGCPVAAPTNAAYCPATYGAVTPGSPCSQGQECHYDQGECDCGFSAPPSSGWTCLARTPGCPELPPRLGAACPVGFPNNGECPYFACATNGAYAFCMNGIWNGGPGGCLEQANVRE